jgi:hypothetical protein
LYQQKQIIMAWKTYSTKQDNTTKHNETCKMAFGNPSQHDNCPRCNELKAGAAPRKGWADMARQAVNNRLSAYCFGVAIQHSHCTKETNPSCACGKMSYTD